MTGDARRARSRADDDGDGPTASGLARPGASGPACGPRPRRRGRHGRRVRHLRTLRQGPADDRAGAAGPSCCCGRHRRARAGRPGRPRLPGALARGAGQPAGHPRLRRSSPSPAARWPTSTRSARLSVGVALLLEYSGAVLVVLWVWLRHGRAPSRLTLTGAVVALVGLVLVLDIAGQSPPDLVGVLWGLLAAVGLAAYFVASSHGEGGLPPVALAGLGMGVGAAGPGGLRRRRGRPARVPRRRTSWSPGDAALVGGGRRARPGRRGRSPTCSAPTPSARSGRPWRRSSG